MKPCFLLVAAVISLIAVPAYGLEDNQSQKITFLGAEVELGDISHTTLTVTFDQNSAIKLFKLPLFYDIQNLKTDSNFGNASCSQVKKPFGSQIECAISPTPEKRMLKLEFDSFDLTQKVDNRFLYKQEFHVPLETKQLSFKVMLPEGMFLASEGDFQPFLPLNGEKGSDGRRIFITWRKESIMAGESFGTQISYEASTDNSQIIMLFAGGIFGLGIIIIALVLGFWFFFKRFKKDIKIVMPVLKSDEKGIMELILRDRGNSNQKLLVRESNYSKAKVSKILKSLQERGIIRLERTGRSNNVYLVKDFNKANEKKENEEKKEIMQKQSLQARQTPKKDGNYIPIPREPEFGEAENSEDDKDENSEQ
jgi:DNA-binding MarR family transcriptional regulator